MDSGGGQRFPGAVSLPHNPDMNFCSHCGSNRVEIRVPEGDNLPRQVCAACGTIHYRNPKIVVGCLPEWGDQVLLCRRAIAPRHGLWSIASTCSSWSPRWSPASRPSPPALPMHLTLC